MLTEYNTEQQTALLHKGYSNDR